MSDILRRIVKCNGTKVGEVESLMKYLNSQKEKMIKHGVQWLFSIINEVIVSCKNNNKIISVLAILTLIQQTPKLHKEINKSDGSEFVQIFEMIVNDIAQMNNLSILKDNHLHVFVHAARLYCHFIMKKRTYYRGIRLFLFVNARLYGRQELSPIHSLTLQLCLKKKNYSFALRNVILPKKILVITDKSKGIKPSDVMTYFYYSALVFIGLKNFETAYRYLGKCLEVPSLAFDKIQIEAFKKYILVHILNYNVHMKDVTIPKNCSQIIHRHMKVYCDEYVAFAKAFKTHNKVELSNIVKKNNSLFVKDNNMGLIKQCLNTQLSNSIILKLTNTFIKIDLNVISKKLGDSNDKQKGNVVIERLLEMVKDKSLIAKISQSKNMVEFGDDEDEDKSIEDANEESESDVILKHSILSNINKSMQITNKLVDMNNELSVDIRYIAKSHGIRDQDSMYQMQQKMGSGTGGGPNGVMGVMKGVFNTKLFKNW